jgi:hypothetical protein
LTRAGNGGFCVQNPWLPTAANVCVAYPALTRRVVTAAAVLANAAFASLEMLTAKRQSSTKLLKLCAIKG